jgi:hypothetical protein
VKSPPRGRQGSRSPVICVNFLTENGRIRLKLRAGSGRQARKSENRRSRSFPDARPRSARPLAYPRHRQAEIALEPSTMGSAGHRQDATPPEPSRHARQRGHWASPYLLAESPPSAPTSLSLPRRGGKGETRMRLRRGIAHSLGSLTGLGIGSGLRVQAVWVRALMEHRLLRQRDRFGAVAAEEAARPSIERSPAVDGPRRDRVSDAAPPRIG